MTNSFAAQSPRAGGGGIQLEPNLIGYYPMDEAFWNGATNEVIDRSGSGKHGVATGETGTSSGSNSTTTLNDTAKSWTTNIFAGQRITITGGTGLGQTAVVVSNTGTQVTINGAWAATPDSTSTYRITPTTSASSHFGRCGLFNGYLDGISLGNQFSFEFSDAFSLEAWVNPAQLKSGAIFAKQVAGANARGWQVRLDATGAYVFFLLSNLGANDYIRVTGSTLTVIDVWRHLVVTYDGSKAAAGVAMYIDGVAETLTVNRDTLVGTITNNADAKIGNAFGGANNYRGRIDHARIYDVALTPAQVAARYAATP